MDIIEGRYFHISLPGHQANFFAQQTFLDRMYRLPLLQIVLDELQDLLFSEPDGDIFPFCFDSIGMPFAILKFFLSFP